MKKFIFYCSLFAIFINSSAVSAYANDTRVVDIVSITWPGAKAFSATISDVEKSLINEAAPRWRTYSSTSLQSNKTINFEFGRSLQDPIYLSSRFNCEDDGASNFMSSIQLETYKRLGIENWTTRYLIILTPDNGCIWSGRALMGKVSNLGGVLTLQDTSSAFVITHELGHTLGLGHSNFLKCDSGRNDGPWGNDCKAIEYGGSVDVMSNLDSDTPLNIYAQWKLGLVDKSEIHQSWLNETIQLSASDLTRGTRAIFIRDGKSAYWIEYRRAHPKALYKPGLVIYRSDPPPTSSIISPNPQDLFANDPGDAITSDIWMLNWDTYSYQRSKSDGSMTLTSGKIATLHSGQVRISVDATSTADNVAVNIVRAADTTAPPKPLLSESSTWSFPAAPLIKAGYSDGESVIESFEVRISDVVTKISGSEQEDFFPTYLNPFTPARMVYLRDLPEGKYDFAIRAIDAWGNKSEWSDSRSIYVDRADPTIENTTTLESIDARMTRVKWNGIVDKGIGICTTSIHNSEGFTLARSTESYSPSFTFETGSTLAGKAYIFDCLGNGIAGEISMKSDFISPQKPSRTGKWRVITQSSLETLQCLGKCTISLSAKGNISALLSQGSVDFSLGGKKVSSFEAPLNGQVSRSQEINIGAKNRILRITGNNFSFAGFVKFESSIGDFRPIKRSESKEDLTLLEPSQRQLSRFGLTSQDFSHDWSVIPMARGITLQDPTLDLCSSSFPSESNRILRRQVVVTKENSPYVFISSESVRYKGAKEAESALVELRTALQECQKNGGGRENGLFTPYQFQSLPSTYPRLVDDKSRLIVHATLGSQSGSRQLLAFYQFNKANFVGLYVIRPGQDRFSEAEVLRWYGVASELASRLVNTD